MLDNLLLAAYLLPVLFGLFLTLPQGKSVADSLSSRFEILQTTRGQVTAGLQIITFFGFAVSAQTFWISSKISEGASFCSSTTVFSCDDLLGNRDLNIDPLFGISWGLLGMFTFAGLLFLTLVIKNDPQGQHTERFINLGVLVTGLGIFVILYLISIEIREGKICMYCTTAHIANLCALFAFLKLRKLHDDNKLWNEKGTNSK